MLYHILCVHNVFISSLRASVMTIERLVLNKCV